jgi:hypothetical protein
MASTLDLIKGSLRLIGVLASGETPSAEESTDALSKLNNMIKSWNVEGLLVFKVTREEFTLTSGQSSRTMGSGGNFNSTKPNKIIRVGLKQGTTETPIKIYTAIEWAEISQKSLSGTPQGIYPEGTHPLETINFYPVPSAADTLVLYSEKPISSALALSDTLSMPDGYEDALEHNLAVRLAPEYGKTLDPLVYELAKTLKTQLKRKNSKPRLMKSDAFGMTNGGAFNFETGE